MICVDSGVGGSDYVHNEWSKFLDLLSSLDSCLSKMHDWFILRMYLQCTHWLVR